MAEQQEEKAPSSEPSAAPAVRKRRRYLVRIFGHWCKGCGLCIALCPGDVFVTGQDGRPLAAYLERCSACLWCVEHCPDFAIRIEPLTRGESRGGAL